MILTGLQVYCAAARGKNHSSVVESSVASSLRVTHPVYPTEVLELVRWTLDRSEVRVIGVGPWLSSHQDKKWVMIMNRSCNVSNLCRAITQLYDKWYSFDRWHSFCLPFKYRCGYVILLEDGLVTLGIKWISWPGQGLRFVSVKVFSVSYEYINEIILCAEYVSHRLKKELFSCDRNKCFLKLILTC